jgi:hypothetical protein
VLGASYRLFADTPTIETKPGGVSEMLFLVAAGPHFIDSVFST